MYGTLPKVIQHHVEETRNENESLDFATSLLQAVNLLIGFFSVIWILPHSPFNIGEPAGFDEARFYFG